MKQRDLLFVGLLLVGVPALAQEGGRKPTLNPATDPGVVFEQGFEADWDTWSTTQIDEISGMDYYLYNPDPKDNNNTHYYESEWDKWNERWVQTVHRSDTSFVLYKGNVVVTDDKQQLKDIEDNKPGNKFGRDTYDIITDDAQARATFFDSYGEDGGTKVFFYHSDSCSTSKVSDEYRRNLFVRLDPGKIQPKTSYRLSFFVRPDTIDAKPWNSLIRVGAGVYRGYFHSEKPFTMGYINKPSEFQYNTKFEYTTNNGEGTVELENGEWKKVTYMTYYIGDSIADRFYMGAYYWCNSGEWGTEYGKGIAGNSQADKALRYVKQPDKFFVRMSFMGDMTNYKFDNLSLTKSWIAGANYAGQILRVDFGYKTNIKELCKAAKKAGAATAAIRIPYDLEEDNFVVYGLKKGGNEANPDDYEEIYIRSAEYHVDGYLYMFTDVKVGDQYFDFDDYDKVLITFKNPKGANQLKYAGDGTKVAEAFPMADDIEWIKAGKVIPDLINEVGTPVPATTFANVFSMENLPPALVTAQLQHPDNSFGLTAVTEFKFPFSRKLWIDNAGEASERVKVTINDVTWNVALEDDTVLVVTKPQSAPALSGDVEIHIMQLYGAAENGEATITDRADDVILHYNFGTIDRNVDSNSLPKVWNAKFYDTTVNTQEPDAGDGKKYPQPAGTAAKRQGNSGLKLEKGDGIADGTAARMYKYTSTETKYPRLLCLSARGNLTVPASLYLGYGDGFKINLTPGNYSVRFAAASVNQARWIKVYVRPWDKNPHTQEIDDDERILIGQYTFAQAFDESLRNDAASVLDDKMEQFDYGFSISTTADYIIEIEVQEGTANGQGYWGPQENPYSGIMISDVDIVKTPISYGPISALNSAVANAQGRVAAATGDKYAGAALDAITAAINAYKIESTFTSTNPADWTAAAAVVANATKVFNTRTDSVDLVVKKQGEVTDKLAEALADTLGYAKAQPYKVLKATSEAEFVFSTKTNVELGDYIKKMDDEIKALDARMAVNKNFDAQLDTAKKLVAAHPGTIHEFTVVNALVTASLPAVYDEYEVLDEEIVERTKQLEQAIYEYNLALSMDNEIITRRIMALKALTESDLLKSAITISNAAQVVGSLDTLRKDNDQLANVYKAAIKAAIYEKAATITDTIDLTPFIKNYYLYSTPRTIEMLDKKQPQNRNDFEYKEESHGFANVAHTKHQWGSSPEIWIALTTKEHTDLVPGWTLKAIHRGSENEEISTDICPTGDDGLTSFPNYKANKMIFDGAIAMDWGGRADLTQEVLGLPAGNYELGIEARSLYKAENKGSEGTTTLTVARDGVKDTAITFKTGFFANIDFATDSVVRINRADPNKIDTLRKGTDALKGYVNDTTFVHTLGNLAIGEDGKMTIKAHFETEKGCAAWDNFSLKFIPSDFDYAAALADAQAEVTEALTIVKAIDAVAENVEYYTLSGIKLAAPKQGEILIRKTTNANGKVVVDKVIIK